LSAYRKRKKTVTRYLGPIQTTCDDIRPDCEADLLHHSRVAVYDRNEDEFVITHTLVERGCVTSTRTSNERSGNPSDRRDGIAIQFYCEGCGRIRELTFAQHKGTTYLGWRRPHEDGAVPVIHVPIKAIS
jgi:hypothetical protein